MTVRRWRLSAAADADITQILRSTRRQFGRDQMARYRALLTRTADLAADDPLPPGSWSAHELLPGLRARHAAIAAGRRAAAVYVFYDLASADEPHVLIVRVLHQRMDPARHIDNADEPT